MQAPFFGVGCISGRLADSVSCDVKQGSRKPDTPTEYKPRPSTLDRVTFLRAIVKDNGYRALARFSTKKHRIPIEFRAIPGYLRHPSTE